MLLLQGPELAEKGVELGVRDLGRVLLVVLLVVVGDLGPELLDAPGRVPGGVLVRGLGAH
jgi:hypothetical protein